MRGDGGGGRRLSTHYVTFSSSRARKRKNQQHESKYMNTLGACSTVLSYVSARRSETSIGERPRERGKELAVKYHLTSIRR